MSTTRILLAIIFILGASCTVSARQATYLRSEILYGATTPSTSFENSPVDNASFVHVASTGLAGGAAGLVAGGLLGAVLLHQKDCSGVNPYICDDSRTIAAAMGAGAGMWVGLAAGAHLGNGGRGSLLMDLAVPLVLSAAVGAIPGYPESLDSPAVNVMLPAAIVAVQVSAVVAAERGVSAFRDRRREALSVAR